MTAATKPRFIKISAKGKKLAPSAKTWAAVLDTTTSLEWAAKPIRVANWTSETEAKIAKKLKASKLAGHTGWRPPTVEEIFLLADRTRRDPAIAVDFFPDCPSDWFWSATPYAPSPGDCAWSVPFYNGSACWYYRYYSGFVRAVRASQ